MYLHQRKDWWKFRFDKGAVMNVLGGVRARQGLMLGRMRSLGFDFQDEAMLSSLSLELVRSGEIEGEILNLSEVRSSIARRLGLNAAGLVPASRYIEGIVDMLLDATEHYDRPLSDDRLFGWHNVLFPAGRSRLYTIEVARYRSGGMQVVSGPMGHERVHYEAPEPERVPIEMQRFIHWVNTEDGTDDVLKAGIAHLCFVSIHPFDDGNGRIARAITELLLARSERSRKRFYSMSNQMKILQQEYYEVLERTQKGDGDITDWLLWFLKCFDGALSSTEETLSSVLAKARFWEHHRDLVVNARQRKMINMQFDGFFGKLTTGKWAKINKCSSDTALNDIRYLVDRGILRKNMEGGRSTNYSFVASPKVES
jgi:Fic family protein